MSIRSPRRRHPRTSIRPICLAAVIALSPVAWALPTGGVVGSGQAQIGTPGAGQMLIVQSTPTAAIDWKTFSIAGGEVLRVQQPGASSVLYNTVSGADPSQILGTLQANGRVFLSNPRGILFGSGAQVDVGGLVATTLRLGANPLAGSPGARLSLQADADAGAIRVEGELRATGTIALVAPQVEVAPGARVVAGRVGIAAAGAVDVDLDGDGLVFFNARNTGQEVRVNLAGLVQADAGLAEVRAAARSALAGTVLNLDGVVRARGLARQGGRIVIDGGTAGATVVNGTLDAASEVAGQRGGDIAVLGQRVTVGEQAVIAADGAAGGGTLRVGGGWQGKEQDVHNATDVTVQEGALLSARATAQGQGGRVVVWSDGSTRFDGTIDARAAGVGTVGGQVETSGKVALGVQKGRVRVDGGLNGRGGNWLLDPTNLVVVAGGAAPYSGIAATPAGDLSVAPAALEAVHGNVLLQATNNITVTDAIALTTGGARLTMTAGNAIAVNNNVSTTGAGNISLTSGVGGITLAADKYINAGAGSITLDAGGGPVNLAAGGATATASTGLITTSNAAGAVSIVNATTLVLNSVSAGTGGGISVSHSAAGSQVTGSLIQHGVLTKAGSGTLTLGSSNTYTGGTTVSDGVLSIAAQGALGATPGVFTADQLVLAGGTLQVTDDVTFDAQRGVVLGTGTSGISGATLDVAAGKTLTIHGAIANNGASTGTLTKTGGATSKLVLAGANTYTGLTTVNGGQLTLSGGSAMADPGAGVDAGAGAIALADTAGVQLVLAANETIGGLSGGGDINLGAFRLTLGDNSNATATYNGQITGAAGQAGVVQLVKQGSSTQVFTHPTNSFTGATRIDSGTLSIAADGSLGAAPGVVTANQLVLAGGTLRVMGDVALDADRGVLLGSGATVDVADTKTLTIHGAIGNNGASTGTLTKTGGATSGLTLAGANSYTGATTVSGGRLTLTGGVAIADPGAGPNATAGAVVLADTAGVQLVLAASETIGALSGGGSAGGSTSLGSFRLTLGDNGSTPATYAGQISGAAGQGGALQVVKQGSNGQTLDGVAGYSGDTQVLAGTLTVGSHGRLRGRLFVSAGATLSTAAGNADALDDASDVTVGGTLMLGSAERIEALTLDSGRVAGAAALTAASLTSGGASTLAADVTATQATINAGALAVAAGGKLSGDISVGAATLSTTAPGQLGAASSLHIQGGSLVLGGAANVASVSLDGATLGGSGALVAGQLSSVGASSLSTGVAAQDATVSAGTLTLTGGVFSAATHVGAGAALVSTAAGQIDAGASFDVDGTLTLGGPATISSLLLKGTLNGTGPLDVTHTAALSGGTVGTGLTAGLLTSSGTSAINTAVLATAGATVTGGTLTVGGAGGRLTTAGGAITVDSGATLATVAGVTDGLGDGSALRVAGALTLGGAETVNRLTLSGTLGGAGSLSVADTATLSGGTLNTGLTAASLTSSGISAINTAVLATAGATVTGGTLTVGGAGGKLTTAGGAITVDSGATLATAAGVTDGLGDGSALRVAGTLALGGAETVNRLTLSGTLGGAGSLSVADTATLSGGTVNTGLTAASLTSSGISAINTAVLATAGATVMGGTLTVGGASGRLTTAGVGITVDSGATLATAAGVTDGLSGGPELRVAGTLTVGGTETVDRLLLSGTLGGAGSLHVTDTATLSGGTVNTGLTAASLTSSGISAINTAVIATAGATVTGGTLTVGGAGGRLTTAGVGITVDSGATLATAAGVTDGLGGGPELRVAGTLTVGGTETVDRLTLSGTLGGAGRLNVTGAATLTGGTVNASLTAGSLTSSGASAINGSVLATGGATVTGGTLTVGGASGRLTTAGVAITVDSGATLATAAGVTDGLADGSDLRVAGALAVGGVETVNRLALSGTLAGAGRLNVTDTATLTGGTVNASLTAASLTSSGASAIHGAVLASGGATVTGGTLTVGGASGRLTTPGVSGVAITVDRGATLATAAGVTDGLGDASELRVAGTLAVGGGEAVNRLALSGTLAGAGQLNVTDTATLSSGTVDASLTAGRFTSSGASVISAAVAATGGATVTDGTLTVGGAGGRLSTPGVAGVAITVASGATLATGAGVADGLGDGSALRVAGALAVGGAERAGRLTLSGTLGGAGTLNVADTAALSSGTVNTGLTAGSLSSDGSSAINAAVVATGGAAVTGGTLTIGGASGRLTTPRVSGVAIRVDNGATLATAAGVSDGLGDGSELQVAGSFAAGGTETIHRLVLSGTLGGAGGLNVTDTATLSGGTVNTGLTAGSLTSSGISAINTAVVATGGATVTGGTMTVGGAGGKLTTAGGVIAVDSGATLATVAGVTGGLGGGSALRVAGTLALGGAETVSGLMLSGTLGGAGSLAVADAAALSGGTVNTGLTVGSLSSDGASAINSAVVATGGATVTGGTLTIGGASGRLTTGGVGITVESPATLATAAGVTAGLGEGAELRVAGTFVVGGTETVGRLALSGTLAGAGQLNVTDTATLSGGTVNTGLTAASLTSSGSSAINAPVLASGGATVTGGTLTVGGANGRLMTPGASGVAITVDSGAVLATAAGVSDGLGDGSALRVAGTLAVGGVETADRLTLSGTLAGAGRLNITDTATLTSGTVNASLTAGSLTSSGSSTINGAVLATGGAAVTDGTLTVGGASGRLTTPGGSGVAITVDSGATLATAAGVADGLGDGSALRVAGGLAVGGAETVGGLTLSGALGGAGQLNVTDTAVLSGGTVNAGLTAGRLTSSGTSALNAAVLATGGATVTDGTLTVGGASGRLTTPGGSGVTIAVDSGATLATAAGVADGLGDGSALQVAGTLAVGGAETVNRLALSGTLAGPGSLRVTDTAVLSAGTLSTGLTTQTLRSQGASSLGAAVQAASAATVVDGLLALQAGSVLVTPTLQVLDGAALATLGAGGLAVSGTLEVAQGARVTLAADEQVSALNLFGVLAGSSAGQGRLTVAGASVVDGGTLAAPLTTDTLVARGASSLAAPVRALTGAVIAGGATTTLTVGGTLSTPSLRVAGGGSLSTMGADQLAGTQTLAVDAGAVLTLGGAERVKAITLAGVANGAGTLTADTTVLDSGSLALSLSTGTLQSQQASRIDGAVTAGTGAVVSDGTLTLAGTLSAPTLTIAGGATLHTTQAERLGDATALRLANNVSWVIGGNETVGSLADLDPAAAAGRGASVRLDSFRLATGGAGSAGDGDRFSGSLSGTGTLEKQGDGVLTLAGSNSYGETVVSAGTLRVGIGNQGSLGTGAVRNDGTLQFARSDTLTVSNAITGRGALEQVGSGVLVLTAAGNDWTGSTRVLAGTLRTSAAQRLPDATPVSVAGTAALELGGDEAIAGISADGRVTLNGSVTTTGAQRYGGGVTVTAAGPITLTAPGAAITALSDGNSWGSQPLSVTAGVLELSAGKSAADTWRDLTLGAVRLGEAGAGASRVDAGRLQLGASAGAATGDARQDGVLQLGGGTLVLQAHAAPSGYAAVEEAQALDPLRGRAAMQAAADVITQGANSRVAVGSGALLSLQADAGSISLNQTSNQFTGGVEALAGTAWGQPWAVNTATVNGVEIARQQRITLAGQGVQVGGRGLDADLVRLTAGTLATPDPASVIRARLWYNDAAFGTQLSTPGLRLTLLPEAFSTAGSHGDTDHLIWVAVGVKGANATPEQSLSAGFVQLLPKGGAQGATAVFLGGEPVTAAGYRFFHDGAAIATEVPVSYNRVLPATPQLSGSLAAVAAVSEGSRRERFEETVRTENVAPRLRAGIIAEVGPGQPATTQSGLGKPVAGPESCVASSASMACGGGTPQATPTAQPPVAKEQP
ncbi:autotransporter-associated beta strand repeat-containing protein [Roseateles sp. BYS96W]|uniref:Autotransporter-associated beta strand repeat-containing protein n=1 Tax=Pelomonas nitida TaxID=3299027 RepID=A0ABW7G304_9BURK